MTKKPETDRNWAWYFYHRLFIAFFRQIIHFNRCVVFWVQAEVSEQAASAWNELSEEMREYWRARARNGNESDGIIERKSSQGIPFSVVDRSQTDKVNLETEMMDRIYDLLNHFSVPVGMKFNPFISKVPHRR